MRTLQEVPELAAQIQQHALAEATQNSRDSRYSLDYKKREVARVMSEAVTALDDLLAEALAGLDQTRADLRKASRPDLTPPADDAIQLVYLRDVLDERWATQNNAEFLAGWKDALDEGDPLVLRVYRDFAIGELRSRDPYADLPLADIEALTPAGDLIESTQRALLTPEQRAAADRLARLDQAVIQAKRAVAGARARLTGARYDPRAGVMIDGQTQMVRDLLSRA